MNAPAGLRRLFIAALLAAAAEGRGGAADWDGLGKEAADFLSRYIRVDSTNPPGNEIAAARFLAERFRAEGLEVEVFESEPARASVLARLRSGGRGRPVVLLSHLDVVPAPPDGWKHPPLAGVMEDGYVYGRGALDMKGLATVEAMAMIALKRAGTPLAREVIFLGTADEEAGGRRGAGWFVEHRLAALDGVEFVLNEGGSIRERADGKRAYEVAVAEKTPFWLRLTATGEAGHGSIPRENSAVARLIRALGRITQYDAGIRVTPEVAAYYRGLAPLIEGPNRERYLDIEAALRDAEFRGHFLKQPRDAALVRNTISPTVLEGSNKTNVIPRTASAEIDVRLLPGQNPQAFLDDLKRVVADDGIEFTVLLNFPPSSSGADSALFRAIAAVARAEGVPVVPSVLTGFTDSHYFRERGIASYGFVPVVMTDEDERSIHGTNERISVENLREGTRRLVAILEALGG